MGLHRKGIQVARFHELLPPNNAARRSTPVWPGL